MVQPLGTQAMAGDYAEDHHPEILPMDVGMMAQTLATRPMDEHAEGLRCETREGAGDDLLVSLNPEIRGTRGLLCIGISLLPLDSSDDSTKATKPHLTGD